MHLSGCATVSSVLSSSVQKPSFVFTKLHLRDISFETVTMDFEFLVNNPNDLGVSLNSLDYALDLDGKSVAKGTSNQGIELKARASAPVRLPLTITFKDFAENVATLFSTKPSVPYAISAGLGVATPVGPIRIPARHNGDLPLPKAPDVAVEDVRLAKMGLTGAKLEFQLSVKNRSAFSIIPKGMSYNLSLAGVDVTKGQRKIPTIDANEKQTIVLPLEVSFFSLGQAVVQAIQTKSVPYVVKGDVDLGVFKQPFHVDGEAKL